MVLIHILNHIERMRELTLVIDNGVNVACNGRVINKCRNVLLNSFDK